MCVCVCVFVCVCVCVCERERERERGREGKRERVKGNQKRCENISSPIRSERHNAHENHFRHQRVLIFDNILLELRQASCKKPLDKALAKKLRGGGGGERGKRRVEKRKICLDSSERIANKPC